MKQDELKTVRLLGIVRKICVDFWPSFGKLGSNSRSRRSHYRMRTGKIGMKTFPKSFLSEPEQYHVAGRAFGCSVGRG